MDVKTHSKLVYVTADLTFTIVPIRLCVLGRTKCLYSNKYMDNRNLKANWELQLK